MNALLTRLNVVSLAVERHLKPLSYDQLNRQPRPGSWSAAQCLDHLIVTNGQYWPVFQSVQHTGRVLSFWEKRQGYARWMGKTLIRSLGPVVRTKMQSPKVFQPSSSELRSSIVDQFLAHQQELKEQFCSLEALDLSQIVTSPASRFVTYPLGDVLEIITGHEERHLQQALRAALA